MHNYHITHKAFLACTIIGSTPSVLGRLLCLSQQNQLEHDIDLQDNQDFFDPGGPEEHKQQSKDTYAVELCTHIAALSALSELDEPPTDSGDGEASDTLPTSSRINNIKITQEFINAIHHATLENGNIDDDLIDCLCNPPEQPADISDPDIQLSLDLFSGCHQHI